MRMSAFLFGVLIPATAAAQQTIADEILSSNKDVLRTSSCVVLETMATVRSFHRPRLQASRVELFILGPVKARVDDEQSPRPRRPFA